LIVGLPGRSNALAIARRLGLNDEIIEDAKTMVATEDLIADDLLDEIHRTREDIRRQQALITAMREDIERERAELSVQLSGVEDERRNIISAGRRNMEQELEDFRRELKRLRTDLRDASMPLETLRAVQSAANKLDDALKVPVQNVVNVPEADVWSPRLGDAVWLETLKAEGVVTDLERDEAVVQIGTLRIRAKKRDLKKPTRTEKEVAKKRRLSAYDEERAITVPKGESPGLELDLRGDRVEEAISKLDHYIDAAYMSRLPFARIIHGKGTGALRKAVMERVREHPLISKAISAPLKEGGDGVTIIYLSPTA